MSNEWIWIIFALINFCLLLGMYRLFGKTGLFVWIGMATVIANIQVVKTIELFGVTATLGNILYGTAFLATDILNEKYGKEEAKQAVWIGFSTLLVMTTIMQGALLFTPAEGDIAHEAMATLFSIGPQIALGSLTAYIVSQHFDVWIYTKIRKIFKSDRTLWLRNNVSTMISQLLDSAIFCAIAFYGTYPADIWLEIFLTTYFIKFLVAALDTPFMYWAKSINR
ncbi:queuosine precursor transporter [Halobacillus massiliensis]|uniref:queuosine precursor transporter n=1 Tax=Halobacillus massiliensis TaxID=1926286 RepID=UPI0009E21F89|nr:queuosine precursor transporter [Halobacillus massiliensis]